ncbi:hypothetical protein G7Y89_g3976 [Cudoniella acicularis]|uniref:Deacetylase sirtuin-type domain-containing protein n=1 Tax=Cudoniella acicularis TaxID=354080 RepID=A0A8H4W4P7_9HELO|nr:hypothetical protein G7Y89_g3976 [Cudoniella acicularis]
MPTINVGPGSGQELQEIADALGKSRKVVVVTGAGISTNCGIPDFRSEDGLYSLIQAQYDAALQNPPWETANVFDIDDRPRKRVKPSYFYEVVAPDGNVVGVIDQQESASEEPERGQRSRRRSQKSPSSSPLSSRSTTPTVDMSDAGCSSTILSRAESTDGTSPGESESSALDTTLCSQDSTQTSDAIHVELSITRPEPNLPRRTSRKSRPNPESAIDSSTPNTSTTSSRPSSRGTSRRQSAPGTLSSATSISSASSSTGSHLDRRRTLQREESSLFSKSEDQIQSSQSSRASLPNLKGRDLFDSMVWTDPFTTSIFYMFISSLRQKIQKDVKSTTVTHKFIRTLRDGGRLVRNYTQNIDCLEEREGLCTQLSRGPGNRSRFHSKTQREPRPEEIDGDSPHNGGVEVVLLHGSLDKLRCGICAKLADWGHPEREAATLAGQAPDCPSCTEYNASRTGRGRRGLAVGRLRPNIVLYGEEHPHANLVGPLITHDLGLGPDVMLIMGTSLKVHGLKVMVKEFAKAVHTRGGKVVFVNRTKPPESTWGDVIDYWVEWDCDAWVMDLKERRSDIWLPQGTIEEPKKKRESGEIKLEIKKPSRPSIGISAAKRSRPQATRDCRMNGVYVTFKILDTLGRVCDADGRYATRLPYFEKLRVSIAASKPEPAKSKRSKSLSAPKAESSASKNRKRKSMPATAEDIITDPEQLKVVLERWAKLRERAPILPEKPSPECLATLIGNFNSIPKAQYPFHQTSNNFPVVTWPMPNLITNPPSDSTLSRHRHPKKLEPTSAPESPTEVLPVIRPTNHAYRTRSSRKLSTDETIMVDSTARMDTGSGDDTIVVATMEHDSSQNSMPTPPESDPFTPSTQRIKRMSSINSILSDPEDEKQATTLSSPEDGKEVWHDASEVIASPEPMT